MPFVIYKSSAGSGKTYTLVKEYLKIALTSEDKFRRILAVTFTNKAAEEMKMRIIHALASISIRSFDSISESLFYDLQKETGTSGEQIISSCRRFLENILHNYSDFSVSTIDSFVHNIVRTFARDLRLSWNFEVETDEKGVLSEAVDNLLADIGKDESLTRLLVDFAESQADNEKGWRIENPLNKLAETLLDDESVAYLMRLKDLKPDDFDEIRLQLTAFVNRVESSIQALAQKALKLMADNNLSSNEFYQTKRGLGGYFFKLSSNFEIEQLMPNQYVKETIEMDKWFANQTHPDVQNKVNLIKTQLTKYFHSIQKTVKSELNNYVTAHIIIQRIHALGVLNHIDNQLSRLKSDKNFVLISEFNRRVHNIVAQETIPFIFERIGEKYEHYLIDEFQDTSALQWSNLLPLVDNSLASDNFNMIVGDGKQAVYRFRNGDVEQFDYLPKIYNAGDDPDMLEREASLLRHHKIKSLRTNYRSAKQIVEFNNALFQYFSQLPELVNKKIYKDVTQEHNPKNDGGYVKIDFIKQDEDNRFNQNVLNKIYDLIRSLLEDGFSKNEIAILTRSNEEACAIATYLLGKHVPVVSSESVLIYRSPEVRFIISVFEYLTNPSNKIARAEMIKYLHGKNSVDLNQMHESLTDVHQAERFIERIESYGYNIYLKGLSFLSLYEIAETVISAFSLDDSPNLFIQHFLDVILSYSIHEGNSIHIFLDWWNENKIKYSVTLPKEVDAIQVMTIHKAKGLEFPVVLLPKADWKIKNGKDDIWISPDLEFAPMLEAALVRLQKNMNYTKFDDLYREEVQKSFLDNLNLLYVATTRASHRLYLFCSAVHEDPKSNSSINALMINFLKSKSVWSLTQKLYEFGSLDRDAARSPAKLSSNYVLQPFRTTSWRKKLRITRTIHDMRSDKSNANWGNIVHAALSKIITLDDIHHAVTELEYIGLTSAEQSSVLAETLTDLLHQNDIKPFFEKGLNVKTEAEMILSDRSILRVDRVILYDQKAIILDYKTGRTRKDDHIKQLNQYARAIQEMGYPNIDKFLLYADDKKLERV